mmetsp:Transcript_18368/g.42374  ORF Transcript_18368/g.42374 Transcript_18368/m.42374 type:complete len:170 (+) Transcript_18368:49-558(+)
MKLFLFLLISVPSWLAKANNNDHHTIRGSHDLDKNKNALKERSRILAIPISGAKVTSSSGSAKDDLTRPKAKTTAVATSLPSVKSEKYDPKNVSKMFGDEMLKTKRTKVGKQKAFQKLKKSKGDPKRVKSVKSVNSLNSFKGFNSDKANKDKFKKFGKSMPEKKFKSKK